MEPRKSRSSRCRRGLCPVLRRCELPPSSKRNGKPHVWGSPLKSRDCHRASGEEMVTGPGEAPATSRWNHFFHAGSSSFILEFVRSCSILRRRMQSTLGNKQTACKADIKNPCRIGQCHNGPGDLHSRSTDRRDVDLTIAAPQRRRRRYSSVGIPPHPQLLVSTSSMMT
jgi:hypothetical protein